MMECENESDDHQSDGEEWSRPVEELTPCTPTTASDTTRGSKRQLQNVQQASSLADTLTSDPLLQSKFEHQRTIIHFDIDCFYAQVEMIRNPALREKPLGIQQKYLVVTCNYVARQRGVTKLMGIKVAREICPDLVLVSGEDLTHYREMSYNISEFLQKYTPNVERLGFDENFVDVSEMVRQRIALKDFTDRVNGFVYGTMEKESQISGHTCLCGCHVRLAVGSQIAADIREALRLELGITCCAGIAHNKLLSKLVAGTHKPNQQTTLFPELSFQLLSSLTKARDIPGIGWNTAKKLGEAGIHSVKDIQESDMASLTRECGAAMATTIKQLSHGVDDTPVVPYSLPQTISDEDSFRKCSTVSEARLKIEELLSSLLKRLLEDGRTPHTFRLSVRKLDGPKYSNRESRQCPIPGHFFHRFGKGSVSSALQHLTKLAMTLFEKMVNIKQPFHLTLINVAFAKLEQMSTKNISNFFLAHGQHKDITSPGQATGSNTRAFQAKIEDISIEEQSKKLVNTNDSVSTHFEHTKIFPKSISRTSENQPLMELFERNKSSENVMEPGCREDDMSYHIDLSTQNDGCLDSGAVNNVQNNTKSHSIGSPCVQLPEGIDPSVFEQLPIDVQKDILWELQSTRSGLHELSSSKKTVSGCITRKYSGNRLREAGIKVTSSETPVVKTEDSVKPQDNHSSVGDPSSGERLFKKKKRLFSPLKLNPDREYRSHQLQIKNNTSPSEFVMPYPAKFENGMGEYFKADLSSVPLSSQNLSDLLPLNSEKNNSLLSGEILIPKSCVPPSSSCGPSSDSCVLTVGSCGPTSGSCGPPSGSCVPPSGSCGPSSDSCVPTSGSCGPSSDSCVPTSGSCGPSSDSCGPPSGSCGPSSDSCVLTSGSCGPSLDSCEPLSGSSPQPSSLLSNFPEHNLLTKGQFEDTGTLCEAKQDPQYRCVTGPAPTVPPDMDEDVFRSLPVEIQAELSLQWQFENIRKNKTTSSVGSDPRKRQGTLSKRAKKKTCNNTTLFSFFRNKNK